jgi:hypothetical protein
LEELLGEPGVHAAPGPAGRPKATKASTDGTVPSEPGTYLRRRVSAAVMRCDDLDILNGPASVATVVLETGIRELDVPVLIRQLVVLSPASYGISPLLRRFTMLAARPVFCLEEPLIFALQILFEDDAADRLTPFRQAFGCLHVRAVDPGIVGQFTRLVDADVERLPVTLGARPARSFKDISPMASERHQRRPRAPDDVRNALHEAKIAKALEVASRARRCPRIRFSQIASGHDAERPDGR